MTKSKTSRIDGWVKRARELMAKRGLTYDDLAAPLGLSTRGGVSHYMNGRRELSAAQAVALAGLFECPLDWLLTGTVNTQPGVGTSVARAQPRPEETSDALAKLRPEVYEIVVRLIAELTVPDAQTTGRRRGRPNK